MAKKPTATHHEPAVRYDVFNVRTFEVQGEQRTDWRKLGVAFPHRDGKGFNVELDLLPLDGKLAVRLYEPKEQTDQ